ncbi:MAG: hypothetical protein ACRCWJ_15115 [Casimicrobium sp.]
MKIPTFNFTKGELDPALQERTDLMQYNSAAKRVRNFVIQKAGGLKTRPGTLVVGEVDSLVYNTELLPFDFGLDFSYVIAPQDGNARVLSQGGMVLEENLKILAVTKGVTTTLQVSFHGYAVGDKIYLSGIEGMEDLNLQTVTVLSVPSANTIVVDIDSRTFADFVDSDGTNRVAPPPPPPTPPPPPPTPPPPPPPPPTGGGGSGGGHYGGERPGGEIP